MNIFHKAYTKTKSLFKETPTNIGNEVASEESQIYKLLYNWGLDSYQNPDTLVGKKGLRIYRNMMIDEQVKATMTVKKYATLSTGWTIKPGDDKDPLSVEMADFTSEVIKGVTGTFYDSLLGIMSAWEYGFSISEIVKQIIEQGKFKGKIGIRAIKTKEPYGYGFKDDKFGNIEAVVFNSGFSGNEEAYNPDDFVIYSYNKDFYSNHYGRSDLRSAYRSYFSKNIVMKFFNIYLERFGAPTVYATYPEGTKKKILDAADEIINNLQARSAFRVPEGIKMELIESTKKGEAGYKEAIILHNTSISRAILMPELLGFGDRASGAQALGEVQQDVFEWLIKKYHKDIEETIVFEQILKPIIDMNYIVRDNAQYPIFQMNALNEDNMETRVKTVEIGVKNGVLDPNEEWIREYMKWPKFEKDDLPDEEDRVNPPQDNVPEPGNPRTDPNDNPAKKPEEPGGDNNTKKQNEEFVEIEKYQLSRDTTVFEKKVGFKAYTEEMEKADNFFRSELIPIFTTMRDKLLRDVERNNVIEDEDYSFINKLQICCIGKLKKSIENNIVKAHLDNKLKALEEMQSGGEPIEIVNKFQADSVPLGFENWEPVPPVEAVEQFNKKVLAKIVQEDGKKKLLTLGKSSEMKYYTSRAFAISGIEKENILGKSKNVLLTGIKQGQANREITQNLSDIFNAYIPPEELKKGKLLSPVRLETIVRTNITDSVNRGRATMFNDPLVKGFVPFVQYSAIIDQRTTEYCESMDGRNFRLNDVDLLSPPAHFNCRSILVPITSIETNRVGGIEVDPVTTVPRAKGFVENPHNHKES